MKIKGKEYNVIAISGVDYLTPLQVAAIHGVDRNSVTSRCKSGSIKALKVGVEWFIPANGADKIYFRPPNYSNGSSPRVSVDEVKEVVKSGDSYSLHETAKICGISSATLSTYVKQGRLPATRVKRGANAVSARAYNVMIRGEDIINLIQSMTI